MLWKPPPSIWLSDRRYMLMRDGRRMVVASSRINVVGAITWGPYADEREAINKSADVIDRVRPDWSPEAKQVALAIGYEESRYGVTKDWIKSDGSPSYNWGAIMGNGDAGVITHADHTADGKPVTWKFAAFTSPEAGFDYWASRWEKIPKSAPGATLKAASVGNARGVSEAMYAACWFSGTCPPSCTDDQRIDAYANVIVGAAKHVVPLLDVGPDAEGESAVVLGERLGLPLGNCPWHDHYKGAGGGDGGGVGPKGPTPTKPATQADDSSGLGTVLLVGAAIAVPLIGKAVLG